MFGMSVRGFATLVATTALFGAACGAAQAGPVAATSVASQQVISQVTPAAANKSLDFTVQPDNSPAFPGGQTLKWDAAKGRWGLTFNLHQPDTRETTLNDIQAGAYYKITPAWRAGGAFSFGNEQILPGPKPNTPENSQPRVQFETKFKF
jgi:hypothetical protein